MKRCINIFVTFVFLFSNFGFCCTVQDDSGTTITTLHPAKRIITLAPDLTEIVFAIGVGSSLIGTVNSSDYPKEARAIPIVGSYAGIDVERIIAMKPDLVLAWAGTFSRQLLILKQFHIPIYLNQPHRLIDVTRTIKNIGCLTGNELQANQLAAQFTHRLQILQQQFASKKSIKVFYQIGNYSFFTINKESWINDVITLCGGKNIFADLKTIAPEVTAESIILANPDVILASSKSQIWKKQWQRFASLKAVKQRRLITLNPDWIERASPRLINGAEQVCAAISLS